MDDVAFLAIAIVEQGNAGIAVGIVLHSCHFGGDIELAAAAKINNAIATLVATPAADW